MANAFDFQSNVTLVIVFLMPSIYEEPELELNVKILFFSQKESQGKNILKH